MKVTTVRIMRGVTINMGRYESLRLDVDFTATLDDGDQVNGVTNRLTDLVKEEVARQMTDANLDDDKVEQFTG